MGYHVHHAIVVTSWELGEIILAVEKAKAFGCEVLGPSMPTYNGYVTMTVVPDGSKELWRGSEEGDVARAKLKAWLRCRNVEWVEVAFGRDEGKAEVEDSPWKEGGW